MSFPFDQLLSSFVLLFLIIDPIGMQPIFLGLTASLSEKNKRVVAYKAVIYSSLLLLFFATAGEWIFELLSISTRAVQITGGILLFKISIDMLMEKREARKKKYKEDLMLENELYLAEQIAISPLAIPMIAGPGAITALVVLRAKHESIISFMSLADGLALFVVMLILFIGFLLGIKMSKIFGYNFYSLISRIMGMMLSILSVQIIIDALPSWWFNQF